MLFGNITCVGFFFVTYLADWLPCSLNIVAFSANLSQLHITRYLLIQVSKEEKSRMAWTQVFEPQFPNSKGKRSRRWWSWRKKKRLIHVFEQERKTTQTKSPLNLLVGSSREQESEKNRRISTHGFFCMNKTSTKDLGINSVTMTRANWGPGMESASRGREQPACSPGVR